MKVKVEKYHIRYGEKELFLNPQDSMPGSVVIQSESEHPLVSVKIRYNGYDFWTNWVTNKKKVRILD